MKSIAIILCLLSFPSVTFAENLILLRKDKDQTSYYESDTIRKTQHLVMVWTVTKTMMGKKHSEYLTELNCKTGEYRQLSLRVFDAESKVVSGDAVYRKWFPVPNTSQVLGVLFSKICTGK